MENLIQFLKFFHIEKRRWILVVGLVAVTHFMCQSLLLPYGNALRSLLPGDELQLHTKSSFLSRSSNADDSTLFVDMITDADKFSVGEESESNPVHAEELKGDKNLQSENVVDLDENSVSDDSKDLISDSEKAIISRHGLSLGQNLDLSNGSLVKNVLEEDTSLMPEENFPAEVTDGNADTNFPSVRDIDFDEFSASGNNSDSSFVSEKASRTADSLSVEHIVKPSDGISKENILEVTTSRPEKVETIRMVVPEIGSAFLNRSSSEAEAKALPKDESDWKLQRGFAKLNNNNLLMNNTTKKLMRCDMPPKSVMPINEMNQLLLRHRRSSRAMRPRWSSIRDQEIVAAKLQIENAPIAKNDGALFSSLFRNVSKFKRSYELMERTLKVYIYKEGEKPIFHQPILKGLYASEGWFMKLMVGNKQFAVKDPLKAHLFYMPFSSRMLEYTLYVRNSHNRTNLRQFLKQYSEKIAAKYRFWNRTGGADHFLVACHDWAPYETRHHMEHCIKALCNADVTAGFKIGRDISLPETYVRSARNPLKDLGGNPPSKRSFLAFYAGNMHGYLRPILLKYWKDKDPGMKIYAPMPPGVASKMNYIQHMQSSKYCLCPKGYEVNSPRVVEAIFYECVPVIISDNFVPPFFEVLNWDAFSVIIAEKDIPNLKDILLAIPEEKYLSMQLAVRKVQKHFLWHAKPLKYDLFHMTLHSIWYNRVYQIKPR